MHLDLSEIREKNAEEYGNEDEEEEEEYEDIEEGENEEEEIVEGKKEKISEMDIIKAKLAKAKKAMSAGLLKRKAAVLSNIERR